MTTLTIDNSLDGDLNKVITWQYDSSEKLIGVIELFKRFAKKAIEEFYDGLLDKLDLSDIDKCDDYGLAIWGKLLDVPRIGENGAKMSKSLYRKLLLGRLRILNTNASSDAYEEYLDYVFDGKVTMTDGEDMSITFTASDDLDDESKWLIANYPDIAFVYPAGVKSHDESIGPVLGFAEQVRPTIEEGQSVIALADQTVQTYVDLVIGNTTSASITIATGSKFTADNATFATNTDTTIAANDSATIRFIASGERYVKVRMVTAITDSEGAAITGINVVNPTRSHTDFKIGNLEDEGVENESASVIAWDR